MAWGGIPLTLLCLSHSDTAAAMAKCVELQEICCKNRNIASAANRAPKTAPLATPTTGDGAVCVMT